MTNIRNALMQAAGTAAAGGATYVEDVFSTHLYTGNGSNGLAIDNGIDLAGEGGLVWMKGRTSGGVGSDNNILATTEQGLTNQLSTDLTNGNIAWSQMQSFDSDGFTLTNGGTANTNAVDYVSWTFRKQEGFFDVVTWTGNATGSRAISHALNAKVGMILVKCTSHTQNWAVYHSGVPTGYGSLNSSSAFASGSGNGVFGDSSYNNIAPTTSVFYVGTDNEVNGSSRTYVAYVFAEGTDSGSQIFGDDGDEAIVKCGSYTGNGSTPNATTEQNGPTVNLGFEPQWLLIKDSSAADDWYLFDTMRGFTSSFTGSGKNYLRPNLTSAEGTLSSSYAYLKINSTGFKITAGTGALFNENGNEYIYMAIRRGPMKEPSAGTDVYNAVNRTGGGGSASITGVGFSPDFYLSKATNQGAYNPVLYNRLRGKRYLLTNDTGAQAGSDGGLASYDMDGVSVESGSTFGLDGSGDSIINYFFKRYPKVFDTVVYEGNGNNSPFRQITHNLGVAPELVIIKNVDSTTHWGTGFNTGNSDVDGRIVYLHLNGAYNGDGLTTSATTVTLEGFGGTSQINTNGETHIMFMFASLSGISKVGAYVGTGNDLNVTDLGSAARFVLIKRTDATGDWYVYDSTRGIVDGNDPYFFMNSSAVQVTNTDYIDSHTSGFTITSSAPDALNASGGKYLYLALS